MIGCRLGRRGRVAVTSSVMENDLDESQSVNSQKDAPKRILRRTLAMVAEALDRLLTLTVQRDHDAIKSLLEGLPREQKGQVFEEYAQRLYQGNGWIAVRQGGRSDEGADILLSHPKTPESVSFIVQCKNQARPLSDDDTRIELLKFEQKGRETYNCHQYRLISVSGYVKDAKALSEWNMLLDEWRYVGSLIDGYDPENKAEPEIELFAHNRNAFAEVETIWITSNRAAVVHPTGTGKSYIIAKAVSHFAAGEVLVLAPNNYILEQLRHKIPWATDRLNLMTYAKGRLLSDVEIDEFNPCLVVLDELHRCGAEEWGKGVNRILSRYPDARVLGTTATPIRYLDACRNMADELFHGHLAGNLSLAQAIVREILPMPKYVCALYTLDEEVEALVARIESSAVSPDEKERSKNRSIQAKVDWEKTKGIPHILAEHIDTSLNKFIVFCRNKEHLDSMEEEVRKWFREALGIRRESYRVVSGDSDSDDNLDRFRHATDSRKVHLLFCIDMLNEGIHMEDVSGVVLLRPTESPTVFYQQIGRCIQVGLRHVPVIFDFVNNFRSIRANDFLGDLDNALLTETHRRASFGLSESSMAFDITDETRDVVEILERIEESISAKAVVLAQTERFCRRYKSLDNLPKQRAEDPRERTDAAWLSQKRQAQKGGSHRYWPEMDVIASRFGMEGLFDIADPKDKTLRQTHDFCRQHLQGCVTPTMRTWQNNVKRNKKRYEKDKLVVGYYPEMETIAEGYGLKSLFDVTDFHKIALDRVEELCEWMRVKRRTPRQNSDDVEERDQAIVLTQLRMAKLGRGKYQFLPEMETIAASYGFPNVFDDIKTRKLTRTREFCGRYQNSRLPTVLSNNGQEKQDAQWLVAERQRKSGHVTGNHYPEMDEIATEHRMPGLFDSPKLSFEFAQGWLKRYYEDNGAYPTQDTGAISYAREDGFDRMKWRTVFFKFRKAELVEGVWPAFTPELVRGWDEAEREAGRNTLTKRGCTIIVAAQQDGYPISGSAINSRLKKEYDITLADLLRPPPIGQQTFTVELAKKIILDEYKDTGKMPSVTALLIEAAESYGYEGLTGNAFNKKLKKLGTSLRVVKQEVLPELEEN